MRETILKIITEIESEKRARAVVPSYALVLEVTRRLHVKAMQELEQMQTAGVVHLGNTINDTYILINKPPETLF